MRSYQFLTISIILMIMSIPFNAHAYLDPGAGSAILQGVLAAIVAIGLTVKIFWHKLLKFFGLRKDTTLVQKDNNQDKG